jgi:lipid II:glycine glycyltransferase (peptidoglycan interpeptide bridge formation enzyme)
MIEVTDSIDWNLWDEFVYNHPHGNIFQTSYMAKVYNDTKNYEAISLAAVDSKREKVLAVLQAAVIREKKGIIGTFSGRSVIIGGPLYIKQKEGYEAIKKLMEHYEKVAKKKAIYTQIRNMWDTEDVKNMIISTGYVYEDHLNYLIDLNQSSEKVWQDIRKSRRGDIKNAEKEGIKINKIENLKEIKYFYYLIQETYKKSRLPLADISLFEAAFHELVPNSMADFYLATQNGVFVGSCIMLKYKSTVYNWYMGSKNGVKYADAALVWHVLEENSGKERIFDFGGAGRPKIPYGVRDFKRRFGGKEVNFGRYLMVHSKWKKNVAEMAFKIYRKFNPSFINHN